MGAFVGFALLFVPPALSQDAQTMGDNVSHGRELAVINCSKCHSTGLKGESPHKKAPAFWAMSNRRPVGTIAKMLIAKATPKHSDMPQFTITPKQARDLAAWIAWVQPITHGKRLAEANCARCHAIGLNDKSKHADALPFRGLSKNYPIDALEESFAEGVYVGHPDMPVFKMSPTQIEDLLAYMDSLMKPQ